jgi:hypothetical protein
MSVRDVWVFLVLSVIHLHEMYSCWVDNTSDSYCHVLRGYTRDLDW